MHYVDRKTLSSSIRGGESNACKSTIKIDLVQFSLYMWKWYHDLFLATELERFVFFICFQLKIKELSDVFASMLRLNPESEPTYFTETVRKYVIINYFIREKNILSLICIPKHASWKCWMIAHFKLHIWKTIFLEVWRKIMRFDAILACLFFISWKRFWSQTRRRRVWRKRRQRRLWRRSGTKAQKSMNQNP